MKFPFLVATVALLTTASLITGCGKKEPAAPPPPQSRTDPATGAIQRLVDVAEGQTEVVKRQVADASTAMQAQVNDAKAQGDAAAAKTQSLIDQARQHLRQNQWSEALTLLSELSNHTLSSDQQSLVQSLKEQAREASQAAAKAKATDQATKAVGGLLPPKN